MSLRTGVHSQMVEVIGGNQYSNILYGKDSRGSLIKYQTENMTYTLLSKNTMEQTRAAPGFVAAKSYNRTDLFQLSGMLNKEFHANNESFAGMFIMFKES